VTKTLVTLERALKTFIDGHIEDWLTREVLDYWQSTPPPSLPKLKKDAAKKDGSKIIIDDTIFGQWTDSWTKSNVNSISTT
jgi:hypothetical protein